MNSNNCVNNPQVICPSCGFSQCEGDLEHTIFDNDSGHSDCEHCDTLFEFERKELGTVYTTWLPTVDEPRRKINRAKFWELDGVWYIETIDEKARFKQLFGSEIIKCPFSVDTPKEVIEKLCHFTFID